MRTPDGIDLVYATKARSLVDAVYDWSRFDTLPRAYEWIDREVANHDAFAAKLVDATIKFGNQGTIRRIPKLDNAGYPNHSYARWESRLRPSSSFIPWIPNLKKRND